MKRKNAKSLCESIISVIAPAPGTDARSKMGRFPLLFLVTAAALVLHCLSTPAGAAATITAKYVVSTGDGLAPDNPAWSLAVESTVALDTIIAVTGAPRGLPSSRWKHLKVKAIHDGTDIYYRFRLPDRTGDNSVADVPLFADGLAIEIPFNQKPSSIAMGNQFQPVNIIYWRANLANPQNIVAGGIGTVQKTTDSGGPPPAPSLITHYQAWKKTKDVNGKANGFWTLIIKSPMNNSPFAPVSPNMVSLVPSADPKKNRYRINFAVWDGRNRERNGVKLVAGTWQILLLPDK